MKILATLLTAFSLLNFTALHAEWNPEYCFLDEDISVLEDPSYCELKAKVLESLKGTWCSQEKGSLLMDLTKVIQPKVCVEVGACTGSTVLPVAATLQHLNQGNLFAIDAWSNTVASLNLDDNDPNKAWWSTVDMEAVFGIFDTTIKNWSLDPVCVVLRNPSSEAINSVDSIDFLHLDGDYSPKGSMEDVALYIPKVKSGGYILFSNLYIMVNGKQPKLKAFCKMFESCEMICSIERDNAILFRKY